MAQLVEEFRLVPRAPRTTAEHQAWNHVARVFGREPSSIRSLLQSGGHKDAWLVKVRWNVGEELDFICSGGVLVGIPLKQMGGA
jgi:hypothetical protein